MVQMSEAVTELCDPSLVQDLRQAANLNFCEVKQLKQSVEDLIADFENHRSLSRKTNKTIERFTERIVDLEASFKQVTDPLMKFICRSRMTSTNNSTNNSANNSVNNSSSDSSSDRIEQVEEKDLEAETATVFVCNLNEFMCERILCEYLRQNEVFVVASSQVPGYNERSRNFRVVVKQCDLSKILDSNLWPQGVTISVRDNTSNQDYPKEAIHGRREVNLPGVIITSGMSYWHDG